MTPSEFDYADDDYDDFDSFDEDDEQADVLPCPECGAEIYEDAEQCPVCGQYIVHRSSVWAGRSPAWIVLGLLGVLAVILALTFAVF